jgi:hypothetical protein
MESLAQLSIQVTPETRERFEDLYAAAKTFEESAGETFDTNRFLIMLLDIYQENSSI